MYPHLIAKGQRHQVRKHIPIDLRPAFDGKPMFRVYIKTPDPDLAYVLSKPIITEWEKRLAEAASKQHDAVQMEIMRLRLAYEQYAGKALDDAGLYLFRDIVAFLFQRYGGVTEIVQTMALQTAKGHAEEALHAVEHTPQVLAALRQITGIQPTRSPFLAHIDDYEQTADQESLRGVQERVRIVRAFALDMVNGDASKGNVLAWEEITGERVQEWLGHKITIVARSTVKSYLVALRAYWRWNCLELKGGKTKKQEKSGPFYEASIGYKHRAAPVPEQIKLAFTPEQLVALSDAMEHGEYYAPHKTRGKVYQMPLSLPTCRTDIQRRNAHALLACLKIKAYTTIRLGAICNIEVPHIDTDPKTGIRYIHVVKDKSAAGERSVPIHPELEPLIDDLIAAAKRDGRKYLIDTWRSKKHGEAGHQVSQDFSALKTELGYGKEYSEHCIRKTVETMWEEAGISSKTKKYLIGHANQDITEGVGYSKYGSPVPMPNLLKAIEAINYPKTDRQISAQAA